VLLQVPLDMSTANFSKLERAREQRAKLYTTVFSQAYSPCGNYLATCSNFGQIAVFSVKNALAVDATEESRKPINSFKAHNGSIYALEATPGFLVSGGPSEIHGWKWKNLIHSKDPKPAWTLTLPSSSPYDIPETNGLAYNSQNDTLISGGGDNLVYIWDLETGEPIVTMSGHKDYIHCVANLEKSNQCVSGSEDGTVRFWDCRAKNSMSSMFEPNKKKAVKRPELGNWISCVAVDGAEQWLVCGGAPYLSCWHIPSSTMTSVLQTPNSCSLTAIFHEGKILTAGSEPTLFHWTMNGDKEAEIPVSPESVYSLAVNKNSKSNKVLSIAGFSLSIDVCTNFNYRAFSFGFAS